MTNTDLAIVPAQSTGVTTFSDPSERLAMVKATQVFVEEVKKIMVPDVHYGTFANITKPSLFQPGAELLASSFNLVPKYNIEKIDLPNGHREYMVHCTLIKHDTGGYFGDGYGSCSTMESKYRYRYAKLTCPACSAEAIIKGKAEFGGGWICYAKKGGCGQKYHDEAAAITSQKLGLVDNPDVADVYHTVLMMAQKRAYVKAVRTATGASVFFTQDVEDMAEEVRVAPNNASNQRVASTQPDSNNQQSSGFLERKRAEEEAKQQEAAPPVTPEPAKKKMDVPRTASDYTKAKTQLAKRVDLWVESFTTGTQGLDVLEKNHDAALEWVLTWKNKGHRESAQGILANFVTRIKTAIGNDGTEEQDVPDEEHIDASN